MVKKLFKHEFSYYFRSFAVFLPIVLAVGAMTRIFRILEGKSIMGEIALSSSSFMLMMSSMALMILSVAAIIVRFYKNLYTAEGYLTFTLPVSNAQHIFVKLTTAIACQLACLLTVVLAACIALSGEPLREVFSLFGTAFSEMSLALGKLNAVGLVIEILILAVITAISNILLYYACITVGQTAKKNRILMAIGVYFAYYMATQVISTVFSIIVSVLGVTGVLDSFEVWLEENAVMAMHIFLYGAIVLCAVISAVFWFVTHTIMSKKLNLE